MKNSMFSIRAWFCAKAQLCKWIPSARRKGGNELGSLKMINLGSCISFMMTIFIFKYYFVQHNSTGRLVIRESTHTHQLTAPHAPCAHVQLCCCFLGCPTISRQNTQEHKSDSVPRNTKSGLEKVLVLEPQRGFRTNTLGQRADTIYIRHDWIPLVPRISYFYSSCSMASTSEIGGTIHVMFPH